MSNIKVEMLSINDFNHICRTCSSDGELRSLFDNIETLSMLESFTQMQFSKTDELPDKICMNCLTKINECFHFINNCKIVDEGLRKCLNDNFHELELKTKELHSSIDIKQDDELPESTAEHVKQNRFIIEEQNTEPNENIKEIDVKQSEYYILKWGSPSENEENKKFEFTVVNNSLNEQDLVEQNALRRLQAANRMRKTRARVHHPPSDEIHLIDVKKIPLFTLTGMDGELENEEVDQRANEIDQRANKIDQRTNESDRRLNETKQQANEIDRRVNEINLREIETDQRVNETDQRVNETDRRVNETDRRVNETDRRVNETDRRANVPDEQHRTRAKLTLPHEEHNALMRRNNETPERIALRRALAREHMRKYRSKLTADETSEHRAQVSENMRKIRAKTHHEDMDEQRTQARDYIRRYRVAIPVNEYKTLKARSDTLTNLQIPLRLSEMAQTLLQQNDPLEAKTPQTPRFSLRPSKIPQVKKQIEPTPRFRSWKRNESSEEVTIRLAQNTLQMKRFYSLVKEPGQLEESALRRAKAAGQVRQYRPMLRKNKANPAAHLQTGI